MSVVLLRLHPGCIPAAQVKEQQIMVRRLCEAWYEALADIPATALWSSVRLMSGSLCASQRRVPCYCHLSPLLVVVVVTQGADGAALLQPHSWCHGSSLSSLQSAEVALQGHLRRQASLFFLVLVISSVCSSALLTPLLPSVCAWLGEFLPLWWWVYCSLPLEPAIQLLHSLKLCSLLTPSCSCATGCPLPQHTFCRYSSTEILFPVLLSGLETSSQLQIACTAMYRTLP